MSKYNSLKKNGILLNKLLMYARYFDHYKNKRDIDNMFVMIYNMRIIHGEMINKLFHINASVNKNTSSNIDKKIFYTISTYNSVIESAKNMINECEKIIQKNKKISENNNIVESSIQEIDTNDVIDNDINNDLLTTEDKDLETENILSGNTQYNVNYPTIVLFYAPWCIHSKNVMSIWDKIYNDYKNKKINIIKINCDDKEDFCRTFKITGYPTIRMFYKEKIVIFDGKRDYENLSDFINEYIL